MSLKNNFNNFHTTKLTFCAKNVSDLFNIKRIKGFIEIRLGFQFSKIDSDQNIKFQKNCNLYQEQNIPKSS